MFNLLVMILAVLLLAGCKGHSDGAGDLESSESDHVRLSLSDGQAILTEGSSLILLPVLSKAQEKDLTFSVVIAAESSDFGADVSSNFQSLPTTVTIPNGQTSANLVLTTINDNVYQGTRKFTLSIAFNKLDGKAKNLVINDVKMTLIVNDDDAPPQIAFTAASQNISENANSGQATVTLSRPSTRAISVAYSISDSGATSGADYSVASPTGTLTFAPGQTTKTVPFTILQDTLLESVENMTITLGAIVGDASIGSVSNHIVSIIDDEGVSLTVADLNVNEGSAANFVVSLSTPVNFNVTFHYATVAGTASAGTDFTSTSGIATIAAGSTSTNISVSTLQTAGVCSADRIFTLHLDTPSNGASISDADGQGTIQDINFPIVSVANASASEGGILNIPATLSAACPTHDVRVTWSTSDLTATAGSDYTSVSAQSAIIPAGQTSVQLPVTVLDDQTYEPSETFAVTISAPTFSTLGAATAVGTITDDDAGPFVISGVTGGADVTADAFLTSGLTPTVVWTTSAAATSYDVTIYQNDGTTVQCATQNTVSTSFVFSGCPLTSGVSYKGKVVAKLGGSSTAASNSLYSFTVKAPPIVASSGPWYVLRGGSLVIQAQYGAAPVVGTGQSANGDTLTFSAVGTPTIGFVTNNSTSLTFTPGNTTGSATFSFTLSDSNGSTVSGTMTVQIVTPFTWTGGGVDSNWNTAANWCGSINANKTGCANNGTNPSSTTDSDHIAIFDGACDSNCSANMNVAVSMYGIQMKSGYSGTITQANTISIGAGGWTQAAGTFSGASSTMSLNGPYDLSGGSFTATSGTMSSALSNWSVSGSSTFNANAGTIQFAYGTGTPYVLTPGEVEYNNITFENGSANLTLNGTMKIQGALLMSGGWCPQGRSMTGGTLDAKGNVSITGCGMTGTYTLKLSGSSNQTFEGESGAKIANVVIASTGGVVNLAGTLELNNNYTYTSGTIAAGTSTINFDQSGSGNTITPGTLVSYNHVVFNNTNSNLVGALNVNGTFTLAGNWCPSSNCYVTGGAINAKGGIVASGSGIGGTYALNVTGNANQAITGADEATIMNLNIASTGGTVSLVGTLSLAGNYTYTSGNVSAGTSLMKFIQSDPSGGNTIIPGSIEYANVTFSNTRANLFGTLTVGGGLVFAGGWCPSYLCALSGGAINAKGNVVASGNGIGGTYALNVTGNANQTITGADEATIMNLNIASAGGTVSLVGTLSLAGNYTYTSGNVSAGTSLMKFIQSDPSGGNTIIPGSIEYANVTFSNTRANLSGTLTVGGGLVFAGGWCPSYLCAISGGAIYAKGNVAVTGSGINASTSLSFIGGTTQTLSQDAGESAFIAGTITVNNSTSLLLATNVSFNGNPQNFDLSSGSLDMGGHSLTLRTLSLNGNTLTKNGGALTVGGSVVGSGGLYGGMIAP